MSLYTDSISHVVISYFLSSRKNSWVRLSRKSYSSLDSSPSLSISAWSSLDNLLSKKRRLLKLEHGFQLHIETTLTLRFLTANGQWKVSKVWEKWGLAFPLPPRKELNQFAVKIILSSSLLNVWDVAIAILRDTLNTDSQ